MENQTSPREKDVWQIQKERKNVISKGKKFFELKPRKGIEYLQKNKIIPTTPAGIAAFLRHEPNLPKEPLGEYIGDYRHVDVLHAYV